jgi:hypothetical protein
MKKHLSTKYYRTSIFGAVPVPDVSITMFLGWQKKPF